MKGLNVGAFCVVVLLFVSFSITNICAETSAYNYSLMNISDDYFHPVMVNKSYEHTTLRPKTLTIIDVILLTISVLLLTSCIIIMVKRNKKK